MGHPRPKGERRRRRCTSRNVSRSGGARSSAAGWPMVRTAMPTVPTSSPSEKLPRNKVPGSTQTVKTSRTLASIRPDPQHELLRRALTLTGGSATLGALLYVVGKRKRLREMRLPQEGASNAPVRCLRGRGRRWRQGAQILTHALAPLALWGSRAYSVLDDLSEGAGTSYLTTTHRLSVFCDWFPNAYGRVRGEQAWSTNVKCGSPSDARPGERDTTSMM